jgi:hypothetical protein
MQEIEEIEERNKKTRQQKEEYEDKNKNERAEIEEKDRKALWTYQEDIRLQIIREGIQPHVPEKHRDELRQKPTYRRDRTYDLLKHKPQNNSLNDFFKKT